MRDEQVKQLLQNFKTIRPDISWKKAHRELLLSQIGAQVTEPLSRQDRFKRGFNFSFAILREISPQFIFRPVGAFALAILLIIGGSVAKVSASNSLPGDVFYSVKIAGEKAQLQLSNSPEDTARLEIEFVGRRIDELGRLLQKKTENGYTEELVKKTMERAEESISHAKESLGNFQKEETNALLAKNIESKTREYEKSLNKAIVSLPKELTTQALKEKVNQTLRTVVETQVVALQTLVTTPGNDTVVTKEELNTLFVERLNTINEKIIQEETTLLDVKKNFSVEIAEKETSKNDLEKIESSLLEVKDLYSLASSTLKEGQDIIKLVEIFSEESQLIVELQKNLLVFKENLVQGSHTSQEENGNTKANISEETVSQESGVIPKEENVASPETINLNEKL